MKEYTIWFEIYGKKLKVVVEAKSEYDAKQAVLNKVIFHKVEMTMDEDVNEIYQKLKDIFK